MIPINRADAIEGVRRAIMDLVDDDHSICEVAGRLGIFCRGLRQFTDEELETRYQWLAERRGATSRETLEDLANRWQLARQLVQDASLSCDVQAREHDTCLGWDEFSNDKLAGFYRTLCDQEVIVVPDEVSPT